MKQPPHRRPKGYYESVMIEWRRTAQTAGLTDAETSLCAAQFAGLSVAAIPDLSIEAQTEMLDLGERAMRTAHLGRIAIKQGFGHPVVPRAEK